MNIAIILSSGFGTRMKARKNKTLLSIGRKPIIVHTINCFACSNMISRIILVVREEEKEIFEMIIEKYDLKKVTAIVFGGKERQHSAYNAVKYCTMENNIDAKDVLLFHNGANPFVSEEEIASVIFAAQEHGAAAVAHRTKDTIKEVDEHGRVVRTLDRSVLWNMQTPQALQFHVAHEAFNRAHEGQYVGTDDVSLAEYIGKSVAIVEASDHNFKITTPRDLLMAKLILQEKRNLLKI